MVAAIKQRVTVKPGGLIEVRSPELLAGQQADVIVLVNAATLPPPTGDDESLRASSLARLRRFIGAIDSGDPRSSETSVSMPTLPRAYGADKDYPSSRKGPPPPEGVPVGAHYS
jgi:hypothetical protein